MTPAIQHVLDIIRVTPGHWYAAHPRVQTIRDFVSGHCPLQWVAARLSEPPRTLHLEDVAPALHLTEAETTLFMTAADLDYGLNPEQQTLRDALLEACQASDRQTLSPGAI